MRNSSRSKIRSTLGRKGILVLLMILAMILLPAVSVFAADVITLKFASIQTPPHPYAAADEQWMNYVEKISNGRIKFQRYWGATLISNENGPMEIARGVADLGYTDPAYGKTGFPIFRDERNMMAGSNNTPAALLIHNKFFWSTPELQAEYPANTIPIQVHEMAQPFFMWTTKKPINGVEDLRGLSIRTSVASVDVLKAVGAQPVTVPMGEAYLMMQKNIVQGNICPYEAVYSFRFYEVLKYQSLYAPPVTASTNRMWNKASFNKLPADLQKLIVESYTEWNKFALEAQMSATRKGEEAARKAGVVLLAQSPAEKAKWDALWAPVAEVTAKRLNDQGLPGTRILKQLRDLIAEYNDKGLTYEDVWKEFRYQ